MLSERHLQAYLEARLGGPVRVVGLAALGGPAPGDVKGYGYGTPVKIDVEHAGGRRTMVLDTITPGPFGHEHMADRAQILLWSHAAFNALPRHVRSLDVGAVRTDRSLVSLGDAEEFFLLDEYVEGEPYARDLERLRDGGELRDADVARADALCDYLVEIHQRRGPDPALYVRRLRELVGGHECIMGILDSFPASCDAAPADVLQAIEQASVRWRWRLKPLADRLRQVHGDFHPWNILFQQGTDFVVLDRSRGEWGEPADDVASLVMNYLFFSLQRAGRLDGCFALLFSRVWDRYLRATGDQELPGVVAPFLAFRGLVMASPVWYPHLPATVRATLLAFVRAVLDAPVFEPSRIDEYCRG